MMRADVEGSLAGFFAVATPLVGGGVLEALPLVAASSWVLFFLRAMMPSSKRLYNSAATSPASCLPQPFVDKFRLGVGGARK